MTTPLDPTRATFVKREHRFIKAEDSTVKARFPNARKITLQTQLGEADASALASAYLAETKDHAQAYTVEIDGIWTTSDLVGDVKRFQCYFDRMGLEGRTLKLVSVKCRYQSGTTVIVVRG